MESDCPPSVYTIADVIKKSIKDHCEMYDIDEPVLFIETGALNCRYGRSYAIYSGFK